MTSEVGGLGLKTALGASQAQRREPNARDGPFGPPFWGPDRCQEALGVQQGGSKFTWAGAQKLGPGLDPTSFWGRILSCPKLLAPTCPGEIILISLCEERLGSSASYHLAFCRSYYVVASKTLECFVSFNSWLRFRFMGLLYTVGHGWHSFNGFLFRSLGDHYPKPL